MCEFCKRFDFSTVSAMTDKYGARIASSIGNSEFSVEQQFNFCPVCGRKLKVNAVNAEWVSVKEKLPEDNGYLQAFIVCRSEPSATSGKVLIETEYFTDEFHGKCQRSWR